ncbi:hypothetical protein FJZ48_03750 [Candidatus Uhrbacteria bacterium]|nr:hypothetical protein [Candidatus Uhrbacteria bacterium]
MNLWNIKRRFASMSRHARPDREFVNALRRELQIKGYLSVPYFQRFHVWWKRALATSSLVIFGLIGTGTYAYASPSVLPDHPLYPVRTTLEQAELNVARGAKAKARVQSKLIARHLHALSKSVSVQERFEDEEADEQDVIHEDVQDVVTLEQQILSEMTVDKALFDEDENILLNKALKEQARRVQQRLQVVKRHRQNTR